MCCLSHVVYTLKPVSKKRRSKASSPFIRTSQPAFVSTSQGPSLLPTLLSSLAALLVSLAADPLVQVLVRGGLGPGREASLASVLAG